MHTFLFASTPIAAHSTNPLPFAARLVERGHRVLWYAGAAFHDQIAGVGAEPRPYRLGFDFSRLAPAQAFGIGDLEGVRAIRRGFCEVFVRPARERLADLRSILDDEPVDAVLADQMIYAVRLGHELGGPAWASFGDGPLPWFEPDTPAFGPGMLPEDGPRGRRRNRVTALLARHLVYGPAHRELNRIRADQGLPGTRRSLTEEATSPFLHLQGCTPGLEYPRPRLPRHMHWVGALRPDPPETWEPPPWWPDVVEAERPVVLVSQGSLRGDLGELVVPTVRALEDVPVLVVVTTGAAGVEDLSRALGGELPGNVRATRFLPYDLVLEHTSVFVTNGGYTGVTLALAHGVPLVQAGTSEEKSEIAARIVWSGVGVRLGTSRPGVEAVRDGVRRVLSDPAYGTAARRLQQEMSQHDAGREGADLLLRLARTGQPVLRAG